jgi:hypothetical protein
MAKIKKLRRLTEKEVREIADGKKKAAPIKRKKTKAKDNTLSGWNETIQQMNERARKDREGEDSNLKQALNTLMKRPVDSTPRQTLPNIDDVTEAFHEFVSLVSIIRIRYSVRTSDKANQQAAVAEVNAARERLHEKLEAMGLASRIDWESREA